MRPEWALVAIVPFLMLVHGLPHLPGDGPETETVQPIVAYPELGARAVDALQGDDYPYPVHADEHIHLAWMAQVVRQETADIDDPYTGEKETEDLFTVQGMRSERGWNVAIVQLHLLTDVPLIALARFLPAIWAGFLGIAVWLTLRPAPGAVAAAGMVALLPTTLRFLGIGFLVPSSFALPWVLVALLIASRIGGAQRFFGLLLLITSAFFMHMVLGTLSLAAAIAGTLVRDEPWSQRASMLLAPLVPLVWVLPSTLADAETAVLSEHTLPFVEAIFRHPGLWLYAVAGIGTALAFWKPGPENRPHRALALLAIPITISMFLSVINDHRNEATYARILFAFFLCFIALASYGLGDGARRLAELAKKPASAPYAIGLAVLLLLPIGLAGTLSEPYYRIHDDESWVIAEALDRLDLGPNDVILAPADQGPLFSAVTGARLAVPFSPGGGAANQDWTYYERNGGDEQWLEERGITVIIGLPPDAPHRTIVTGLHLVET